MAKKITAVIKLQVPAGKATPAPPVGTALGPQGVNIMEFCKAFNERTANQAGMIIPVEVTVYEDRSFTFITKTPPASVLLKKAAGIEKGSGQPNTNKVATVTRGSSARDRRDQDARSQRVEPRSGDPDDRGNRPQHGDHHRRLTPEAGGSGGRAISLA